MKTYKLEFIGRDDAVFGHSQDGRMQDSYCFEVSAFDADPLDLVRAALLEKAYWYFTWFNAETLAKYGKTRNGSLNVFTWREMEEIAAAHGFYMRLYSEIDM